jgi:hypothetical protein
VHTNFVSIIKQIVSQQGEAILGNPVQLKVFVRQYAKHEPKEIRLAFGRCVEQGYYRVLKQISTPEERLLMKPKIARQMHNISKLELPLCAEAVDILEAVLYGIQPVSKPQAVPAQQPAPAQQSAPVRFSRKTGFKVAISAAALIFLIAGFIHWNKILARLTKQMEDFVLSNSQEKDVNGLSEENYDSNGWAYINGNWVSNPRPGAFIRYPDDQTIATASKPISNVVVDNKAPNPPKAPNPSKAPDPPKAPNPSRAPDVPGYLSSIEDIYPLLIRVAEDLQYSDIPALQTSFNRYKPLAEGHFYEMDGKRFYSNQELFDFKIQLAQEWGSRNDQNGDGVINCEDYAELFFTYASSAGYPVRYITNSSLNHAFNQVKIQNEWISIEPQSAETGLNRPPLESVRFPNYNPAYDVIRKENKGAS